MKINLIGMILNNCRKDAFNGALLDDHGDEMDEIKSLDTLIMEYAKVRNGGQSDVVVVSRRVLDNKNLQGEEIERKIKRIPAN